MNGLMSSISFKESFFKGFFYTVLVLTASLSFASSSSGHADEQRRHGFNPISQEVLQDAEDNLHAIVEVKANKVGLERIQHEREAKGLPRLFRSAASHEDELVLVKGQTNASLLEGVASSISLPSSVDNSQLPSFPNIGDQKQLGSCVAWGTTYYQATHEYGLLNGINNKSSISHVFSPKWTYNNLNGGQDQGLMIFETYQLFSQNGIVTIDRLPYDSNYKAWDLNPQDWISAISYRTRPAQLIAGIGGETQNLDVIKQFLNNGHILTFGTFIESWKMTTVKKDPNAASNPHAGELAAAWMSGTNGGHCMTIVGFDDNVWIDINNDGKVDAGEKGAFLVANSWSENWGNKGFVWIAYDAFLNRSSVPNAPSQNRIGIAEAMGSYVVGTTPIAPSYSPKMIAQFTLTQSVREQISVSVGISDTNSTKPTKLFKSYALFNQGGNLEFDGDYPGKPEAATFALDLTDLLQEIESSQKRFYLVVGDDQAGNPTTVDSFSIIDNTKNNILKSTNVPVTLDNTTKWIYIDYGPNAPAPLPVPPVPPVPPVVNKPKLIVTSPMENQTVANTVWLSAIVKDKAGIERVEFHVDSVLYATDRTAPYYALLSTRSLVSGKHKLTVIAYNKQGESTAQTVKFNVR